jgi:hypothetical protein
MGAPAPAFGHENFRYFADNYLPPAHNHPMNTDQSRNVFLVPSP